MRPVIALLFLVFYNSVTFSQNKHRIHFAGEDIPLEEEFVRNRLLHVLKSNGKSPGALARLKEKSDIYFPFIVSELRKHGIPEDFKYLPIVESGMNNVTSHAGAHGFWQFMPETAKELGLKVTYNIDERNNVVKSTVAACKHLQSLYKEFGSWTLAACAYNFGSGNVRKTIRAQKVNDYYRLRLNKETALYVYRLLAIKELFEKKEYGYSVIEADASEPLAASSTQEPASMTSLHFALITVDVKTNNTAFLDFVQKEIPRQAVLFFRLLYTDGRYFGEAVNDCDMFGIYIRKGTLLPMDIEKGDGSYINANVIGLSLADLSGAINIDTQLFYDGLILKVHEQY